MTARLAPPSAMRDAIRKVLLQPGASLAQLDVLSDALIAAMFDNLPREVMVNKVAYEDCWREVFSHSKGSLDADVAEVNRTWKRHIHEATEHVDAAISAARATLLPDAL